MIVGIGIDLVDVRRFDPAKPGLLRRLFTDSERAYCSGKPRRAIHLAGRFAAKEAFLKALGTGYSSKIGWKEIEVVSRPNGSIELKLQGVAASFCKKKKIKRVRVSMSHTKSHSVAVVVIET